MDESPTNSCDLSHFRWAGIHLQLPLCNMGSWQAGLSCWMNFESYFPPWKPLQLIDFLMKGKNGYQSIQYLSHSQASYGSTIRYFSSLLVLTLHYISTFPNVARQWRLVGLMLSKGYNEWTTIQWLHLRFGSTPKQHTA